MGAAPSAPSVVVGPRGADFVHFACFCAGFGGLVWAAPSAPLWLRTDFVHFVCFSFVLGVWSLWLWAIRGADFANFVCFSLVWGSWWGLRPRLLCGYEPLLGLILVILIVFDCFGGG